MKFVGLLALQTVGLAIVFSSAARAEEGGTPAYSKQALQAKLEYCKTCHGLSGQCYRGYFPMPRLAGQQTKYLENQLRAFIGGRRRNPVMFNVAHALSPSMVAALAEHFRDLNPSPLGGAPREPMAIGKTIYDLGLPEANVPAYSACHGPEAKGARRNSPVGRSALSVHSEIIDVLEQRARSWVGEGYVVHYGADYAQLDPITDCRNRGLRQQSEVKPIVLLGTGFDECVRRKYLGQEVHEIKNRNSGDCCFWCRSAIGG
jgi:cytochrome c553